MAFPSVASTSSGYGTGNSVSVTLPSGVTSGDLLLVFFTKDGSAAVTSLTGTGWAELCSQATAAVWGAVYWKEADGSDSLDINYAGINERTCYVVYRITGWDSATTPAYATDLSSTNNRYPDAPSLNPAGWGTEDTLWIAAYGWDDATKTHVAHPTNYSIGQVSIESLGTTAGCGVAAAARELAADSEDPGTGELNGGDTWWSATIAVRPAGGGGGATDLVVQDATHGHTFDAPGLTVGSYLAVDDALHSLAVDGLVLTTDSSLAVAESTHDHTLDNITLSLAGSEDLVVADATHDHTVDALTLTADAYLTVADTVHAHTIDNVVLGAEGVANLVVADSTHALTVDGLTLTSESLLAVQDALHSLGVDAVTLSVDAVLALQDALHAHTSDNLTLTLGGANLLVAESLHALTVDGVALTVDAYLVVLDARHVHTIDNVNLVIPGVVTGEANWVVFVAPESRLMLVPADFRAMLVPPEDADLSV